MEVFRMPMAFEATTSSVSRWVCGRARPHVRNTHLDRVLNLALQPPWIRLERILRKANRRRKVAELFPRTHQENGVSVSHSNSSALRDTEPRTTRPTCSSRPALWGSTFA